MSVLPLISKYSEAEAFREKIAAIGPGSIRHVGLIYNPASGQLTHLRREIIANGVDRLRAAGLEAEAWETYAPGSATELAQKAIDSGCDTVFACGGDGTVHEVLQRLVGTDVNLGVVPLGTANALAMDLGLGSSPLKAIGRLIEASPMRVPVGRICYRGAGGATCSRYFTVAAGVGADALFLSRLDARWKQRLGYLLYVIEAFRVWATHSFPLFEASFAVEGQNEVRREAVSQLLAVRIRDFGGAINKLAPGAALTNDYLRLMAFKTRRRLDFLSFFLAVLFKRQSFRARIELLDAASVECQSLPNWPSPIFVEADGEILGTLPARMEIVPNALNLLIPKSVRP